MKTCFKCLRDLPVDEFYSHPRMGDGLLSKCKECTRVDVREHRKKRLSDPAYVDAERDRGVAKYYRLYRGTTAPPAKRLANAELASHRIARNAVAYALRAGRLQRPANCSDCGLAGRVDGHHEDYTKPLDVVWLCKPCHGLRHRLARRAA